MIEYPTLAELQALLDQCPDNAVVARGFADPHSWRGVYAEVAFEPITNAVIHHMKEAVALALTETFVAYKGGNYRYNPRTACHLDYWGEYKDLPWDAVLKCLRAFAAPELEPEVYVW